LTFNIVFFYFLGILRYVAVDSASKAHPTNHNHV